MKICHIITRLIIGGAQENTVLTCKGLSERGHDVTLIAGSETGPEGSLWRRAREAGCALIEEPAMRRAVNPWRDWGARNALRKHLERIAPHVVHTHSSKAGILGRSAARAAGVGVIVHTIHGMSFNRTQPAIIRGLYRFLERRTGRYTTALVTVADAMIEQAVAAGLAGREKFTTIRSGIETDLFRPDANKRAEVRRQWGIADDEVVVGTIARLFKNKGYEEILAAMPAAVGRYDKLRFVWIGDGAHRAAYERRLDGLGLRDRVRLVGLITPEEVAAFVSGFDVLLHASRWEGLPRAVVQGLLCQVPAISFDNDGAPEVVLPGETGLLVPLGDVGGLSDAIVELASDDTTRRRMGEAGRALCVDLFDWKKMVDEIEALYERLV